MHVLSLRTDTGVHSTQECLAIKPIYEALRTFDKGSRWDIVTLNLFGQYQNLRMVDPGVSLIHFVIWKCILIALTRVALDNVPFAALEVLELAKGGYEGESRVL